MIVVVRLLAPGGNVYQTLAVQAQVGEERGVIARGYRTEPGQVPALVEVPLSIELRLPSPHEAG